MKRANLRKKICPFERKISQNLLKVLTTNLNLEFFGFQIFNSEGRSLEFSSGKLELAHTLYLGVLAFSFISGKK
jgi:hypothetical protein